MGAACGQSPSRIQKWYVNEDLSCCCCGVGGELMFLEAAFARWVPAMRPFHCVFPPCRALLAKPYGTDRRGREEQ